MKKHKAMSIAELLIAITIMGVLASSVTLAPTVGKQTAKREAERIAAYLIGLTHEFGAKRKSFILNFSNSNLPSWKAFSVDPVMYKGEPRRDFYLKDGCTFNFSFSSEASTLTYIAQKNNFNNQGGHITITDYKGEKYKVIISLEGRIMARED